MAIKGKLLIWTLRAIPKGLWSRFMGALAHLERPRPLILKGMRWFSARYGLALDEAEHPIEHYKSVGDLFTRRLKEGTHDVCADAGAAVSPADGHVLNSGRISDGRLIQCKGHDFHLSDLLADPEAAERFMGGSWVTVYLSPRDYHRVHHPIEGTFRYSDYQSGKLWPVNQAAVENVRALFCVNERVITYVDSPIGEVATIMVGATAVGHISTRHLPELHSNHGHRSGQYALDEERRFERAEELGTFHLGSTAIVLFANPEVTLEPLEDGQPIRLGAPIARGSVEES